MFFETETETYDVWGIQNDWDSENEEEEEEDAEQDEVEGNEGNKPGISHLILTRLEMLIAKN